MSWMLVLLDGGKRQHVIPVDDLVEHVEDGGCVCGPDPQRHITDSGLPFTQWVHASLDGREHAEP